MTAHDPLCVDICICEQIARVRADEARSMKETAMNVAVAGSRLMLEEDTAEVRLALRNAITERDAAHQEVAALQARLDGLRAAVEALPVVDDPHPQSQMLSRLSVLALIDGAEQ